MTNCNPENSCVVCGLHACSPPHCDVCVDEGKVKCAMCDKAVGRTHYSDEEEEEAWCMPCFYRHCPDEEQVETVKFLQSMGEVEYYHEGEYA